MKKVIHSHHVYGLTSLRVRYAIFQGGGQFFSWPQALYEFYFTSLQYISLLCVAVHDFYFLYKSCAGIFFRIWPIPPPPFKNKIARL